LSTVDGAASQQEQHLTAVGAEQESQCLAHTVLRTAPLLDTGKQQAEVVDVQEYVGDLSGCGMAVTANSNPDVCGTQRRAVIDASAEHRHDPTGTLQSAHDLQLLCRADAGEDIGSCCPARRLARLKLIELVGREHAQLA